MSDTTAAILTGPQRIDVRRVPLPQPGPGQVRVRLHGCGICASSLPVWEGRPWFKYPLSAGAPGHEGWGQIEALGEGVEDWTTGTPVCFVSQHAFAQHDLADASGLVRIPAELADQPLPGEPLGCAMNVFRRSEIEAQHTVAVIGVGFLGALLTRLAVTAGARVLAVARSANSLQLARELGANEVLPWQGDVAAQVRELTGGRGCERVVEAVGAQPAIDLASALIATRGRLVIAGYHQDGPRQVNMQSWNWNGIDVVNAHERDPAVYREGMRAALDALHGGRFKLQPLLTHRVSLEELGRGFQLLQERPPGFVKAYVDLR